MRLWPSSARISITPLIVSHRNHVSISISPVACLHSLPSPGTRRAREGASISFESPSERNVSPQKEINSTNSFFTAASSFSSHVHLRCCFSTSLKLHYASCLTHLFGCLLTPASWHLFLDASTLFASSCTILSPYLSLFLPPSLLLFSMPVDLNFPPCQLHDASSA